MDLLNRYLNTIRWNLPSGTKADDIIAELGDVIASRIEDREEALGRPLTREEASALLRDFGHPLVVASSYGKQQWLIGPEIFPFYWFTLKVVLAICAAVLVVIGAIEAIVDGSGLIRAMMHAVNGMWWSLLGNAALVTLVFAVIERTGWLGEHLRRWRPEQLPDLSDFKLKPRSMWNTMFEVAVGAAFILWWTGAIDVPTLRSHMVFRNGHSLTVEPSPVWMQLYWPILGIAVAQLLCKLILLLRPRWRTVQAVIGGLTTLAGLVLLATLYQSGRLVTIVAGQVDAARQMKIQESLDLAMHIALLVTAAIWVIQWLASLRRMRRA